MLYKLESLRGVAALIVVMIHSPFTIFKEELFFMAYADYAVDFFFILSGMVMALSYQERITTGMRFKSYLLLRFARLYPLHIFTLLLLLFYFVAIYAIVGVDFKEENNLSTFVSNLFLIHSLGIHNSLTWNFPSWSISTEFYTYILFYLLLLTIDKRTKLLVPSIIMSIIYLFLSMDADSIASKTYDYGFFRSVGGFYLGVILFRMKEKKILQLSKRINAFEWLSFLVLFLVIYLLEKLLIYDIFMILSLALIIFVFSDNKSGYIGNILNTKYFKTVGKYSYSIYMLHLIVILFYTDSLRYGFNIDMSNVEGISSIALNLLICLTIISLSKFSYQYIEHYFRSKAKRYCKGL
jgi:peptidoglycan/LPS O-acetylase OafA/YrhL